MSETKRCSECLEEIHVDARKCRHCGSKVRGGCLSWVVHLFWFLFFVGLVVALLGG